MIDNRIPKTQNVCGNFAIRVKTNSFCQSSKPKHKPPHTEIVSRNEWKVKYLFQKKI